MEKLNGKLLLKENSTKDYRDKFMKFCLPSFFSFFARLMKLISGSSFQLGTSLTENGKNVVYKAMSKAVDLPVTFKHFQGSWYYLNTTSKRTDSQVNLLQGEWQIKDESIFSAENLNKIVFELSLAEQTLIRKNPLKDPQNIHDSLMKVTPEANSELLPLVYSLLQARRFVEKDTVHVKSSLLLTVQDMLDYRNSLQMVITVTGLKK